MTKFLVFDLTIGSFQFFKHFEGFPRLSNNCLFKYGKWRTTEITTTGFSQLRERIFDIHCKLALNTFKCLRVHFAFLNTKWTWHLSINPSLDPRISPFTVHTFMSLYRQLSKIMHQGTFEEDSL